MDYEFVLSIDWILDNHGKDSLDLDAVGIVLKRYSHPEIMELRIQGLSL